MYVLTIYREGRKLSETETFAPPTDAEIAAALKDAGDGAYPDISRKDHEPEDFDYRDDEEV
jgi:hypothetical protein